MRRAGRVVAVALARLEEATAPGVTTAELDALAESVITAEGAQSAFQGLYGYPANICASINDEVVHGIPGPRRLRPGDIVSFDLGAVVDGCYADGAITVGVGEIPAAARQLLQVTREALARGIAAARPGRRVSDISAAIQRHAEAAGYTVVRDLVGHGIGREMHEAPQVPNFVPSGSSAVMRPGLTLAIEPMVNEGASEVVRGDDGWTYRTRDGRLSAHFEHTVAVLADGPEILTRAG